MKINEYNREIIILGFGEVKVDNVNDFVNSLKQKLPGVQFQVFDAEYVAGRRHLFFAALNALKVFEQGENISDNVEMEALLYASGQRQIKKAIELLGLRPTTTRLAMLVFLPKGAEAKDVEEKTSNAIRAKRNDDVLDVDEDKIGRLMKTFQITPLELETIASSREDMDEAVTKAVVERIALLATQG